MHSFNNFKKRIKRRENYVYNLIIKKNARLIIVLFSVLSLIFAVTISILDFLVLRHFDFLTRILIIFLSIPLMFIPVFSYLFSNTFSKLIKAEGEMRILAMYDAMTKLPARQFFMESANKILSITTRKKDPMALLYIDVDNFKKLNDRYGHGGGDAVLKKLGDTIFNFIRKSDVCGRIGGEEFAICSFVKDLSGAEHIAEKLIENVRETKVKYLDETISFTISIGITFLLNNDQNLSLNEILSQADMALYESKRKGKDKYTVYKNTSKK